MAGKLFIVPTPVGNLDDMTFRAVQVLKEADLILAEDTRTSSVLLHHYDIRRPLQSHHKFNEHQTVQFVKERILGGLNVALVSDAGTPASPTRASCWPAPARRKGSRSRPSRAPRPASRPSSPPACRVTASVSRAFSRRRKAGRPCLPPWRRKPAPWSSTSPPTGS